MATRKAMAMRIIAIIALALTWAMSPVLAQTPVPVTADNFVRAETHMYFNNSVSQDGFSEMHQIGNCFRSTIRRSSAAIAIPCIRRAFSTSTLAP